MAYLNRRFRRDERSQIILIAALALAVVFVALALIVNSAIFTENLASRGEMSGSEDALQMRHEVERGMGDAIRWANKHNNSGAPVTELDEATEKMTANVSHVGERHLAENGRLVNVTLDTTRDGTRIVDNSSGGSSFQSMGGNNDWSVVDDIEQNDPAQENVTRAFEIRVIDNTTLTTDDADSGNAFEIEVEDYDTSTPDPDSYNVFIWRSASTTPVTINVETRKVGGSPREDCAVEVPQQNFTIDVTRGRVAGTPCDALQRRQSDGENFQFGAGVDKHYNISFANGHNINGNYSLVTTNTSRASSNTLDVDNPNTAGTPFITDAIYDAVVDFRYDSPGLTYESEIRVARGEPDA